MLSVLASTAGFGLISVSPSGVQAAVPVAPLDLGLASGFAILAGDSVGNTATGPITIVRSDLGVVAAAGAVTGFPPGEVWGTLHEPGAAAVVDAHADLESAYADAAGRVSDFALAGDLIGLTLLPGVHTNAGAVANTGSVTLDGGGDSDAVFIFQVNGALAMAAGSKVLLTGGTEARNVYWQVNGAGAIGAGSQFVGTLMTATAIGVGANSVFNGRALARTGAITTDSNQFYSAPPSISIDGGGNVSVADETPTISGTSDVGVGATVKVTIADQTLSTDVQEGGTWSVMAAILPNGTYAVVASVVDGAGNIGSAHQTLTIDTVPPVVTIAGGASRLTNDSTPTIEGTSDLAPGAVVVVVVAGQTLTALVQTDGTWNTAPTALSDGVRPVVASVVDEAGNPGSATQLLEVDTVAPIVAIDGGATRLTSDPTPTITGTSTEPGAVVVMVSGLSTPTTVQPDGTWSITTASLHDGTHPVAVTVTDAAGNVGTSSQSLTVDTVGPTIRINGGPAASVSDTTPTIVGSTSAAPGSVVTVTIAGQVLTTLVQPDGSWNATPTEVAIGIHVAVASVSDAAGNVTVAEQVVTVSSVPTGTTPPPDLGPPPTLPRTGGAPPDGASTPAIVPVGPRRVFDTRAAHPAGVVLRAVAIAQVGGAHRLEVQLTDLAGYVPATGVGAVSLNVTVANSAAAGYVTVDACGTREEVSSVNFAAGQTVANAVISPVSSSGTVCFWASTLTDIIVDVNGWLPSDAAYSPVGPKRLFDTRPGASAQALRTVAKAPVPAEGMIEVPVTDMAGLVPALGVDSVSLNVTVTNPTDSGYITVYACGTRVAVSSVNYVAGQTVANSVIAPISPSGTVCFYASASTDLVVDINGWFAASAGFNGFSPRRVLDTRPGSVGSVRKVTEMKVGAEYVLTVRVTDLDGVVPVSDVAAVSLNVTATNPDGDGFVTVYPCGVRDEVSSLNYALGRTVANGVITPVSGDGTICLYSFALTDLIVDINGWFATSV